MKRRALQLRDLLTEEVIVNAHDAARTVGGDIVAVVRILRPGVHDVQLHDRVTWCRKLAESGDDLSAPYDVIARQSAGEGAWIVGMRDADRAVVTARVRCPASNDNGGSS